MKNSLIKDTFREIRKTKSRFFSIFAIVAIGTGFFAGVIAAAPVMRWNADRHFDRRNLMDYRIMSNFGLTEEDIDQIEAVEGVEAVRPAYEKDVIATMGTAQTVMRIHSLDLNHLEEDDPKYINQLTLKEGRLPRKSGEIVIEAGKLLENDLQVGDTIVISSGNGEDILDTFRTTTYKIVGKVESIYYLSYEKGSSDIGGGSVGLFAYVPREDFDMEVYTQAFVTLSGADALNSYEEEYFDYIEPVTDRLETLGVERSDIRREDILAEAQEKYDEGYREYQEGLAEFDSRIAKREKDIKDAEDRILKGEIELSTGQTVAEAQFRSAQQQIDSGKATLESLKKQYADAQAQYDRDYKELETSRDTAKTDLDKLKAEQTERQAAYDKTAEKAEIWQKTVDLPAEISAIDREIAALTALLDPDAPEEERQRQAEIQKQIDEKTRQKAEKERELEAVNRQIDGLKASDPEFPDSLATAERDRAAALVTLEGANTRVTRQEAVYNTLNTTVTIAQAAVKAIEEQIAAYEKQVADGEAQLARAKAEAARRVAEGNAKLAKAKIDLANGKRELSEKQKDGQRELDDAYNQLVKAKADIEAIEQAKWYVLDRNSHYSYVDYKGATERMDAISAIFPVFFFLVSALVCLTTMTRMVDEERTQIGTLKALGYTTPRIAFKYVFYAAFASLTGAVIGLAFGSFAFPYIIYTAWNMMYILPPMKMHYIPSIMVGSALSSRAVTTGAAFLACYKELVETPSVLMRPKTPKLGKKILLERVTPLWNRLSFTSKVTARNLFRYKKRFLMTVIGISGCTALLVAGFGIKDSISDLVATQFEQVFHFDGEVSLTDGLSATGREALLQDIKNAEEFDDAYGSYMGSATIEAEGESMKLTLSVILDADNFENFVDLHDRKTGRHIPLKSGGAVITEHAANTLGLKVGDTVRLTNRDGITKDVEITGISENYIGHYLYMTGACYKNTFDQKASVNTVMVRLAEDFEGDDSAAAARLTSHTGVDTVHFYTSTINNFSSMVSSLNYIVIVLIISAGALAFVVLYNLTNVNISERLREIATLKVLGFHNKEVNRYVYRENVILTFIGSLLGLYLGKRLHLAIMVMVELDDVMFGRVIKPGSLAVSVVITMVFAAVVNIVMKKRLSDIPMVESLKSVE